MEARRPGEFASEGVGTFIRAGMPEFRRVNLALAAAGFSTYALLYCTQPLLPVFSRDLHISPSASSLSLSLATAMLALAMLIAGRVSDVRGRKTLMALSLFAAGVLTFVSAFAPDWTSLLVIRAITGAAMAGVPAVAMAYLAEEIQPRDLGVAMGLYIAGNAYGGMAGRVLTGIIVDATGSWRAVMALLGLMGIAAAVLFVVLLPASRRFQPETGLSPGHLLRAFAAHLRDPGLVQLFFVPFLLMGAFIATYNYLSYRLAAPPFSLPEALAGAIFLVYLLGGPASAWFGRAGARFGRALWLILALGLMLAGLALTASSEIVVTILGIATLTCGFFGAHSIASGWVGHRAKAARAQAASLYLFAYYTGSSLFGWAGGFFWARWGWPGVMALVTSLILLAMGLAYNLGRGERREAEMPGGD